MGGFGSAILETMQELNYNNQCIRLGVPDKFIEHATQQEQYELCGFSTAAIIRTVEKLWTRQNFK